jgi:hypothetical protein
MQRAFCPFRLLAEQVTMAALAETVAEEVMGKQVAPVCGVFSD